MFKKYLLESSIEYKQSHEEARINAAKPIEQGGLGLPENNTAMDRAKAMGFDIKAYHATPYSFNEFKINPYRKSVFFARNEKAAIQGSKAGAGDYYGRGNAEIKVMPIMLRSNDILGLSMTNSDKKWHDVIPDIVSEKDYSKWYENSEHSSIDYVKSLYFNKSAEIEKNGEFFYIKKPMNNLDYNKDDFHERKKSIYGNEIGDYSDATNERWNAENAIANGKKGFMQNDEAGISIGITNPNVIRSVHAAFDPFKKHSSNIMD